MSISKFHAAARRYAEAGIPIFPCKPGSKDPWTAHGFHDATTSLAQIDTWWSAEPDLNPAFTPHSMGWGIVDIDGQKGWDAWNDHAQDDDMPTWEVQTPRGGAHLYYAGELPTSVATRVVPGAPIDTRGRGSYALLPPSHTDAVNKGCATGDYVTMVDANVQPLPEWVAQAIRNTERGGAIHSVGVDLDIPANVARARAYLRDAAPAIEGQGGDQATFVVAATLHNLGISEELALELMEDWNERCDPPWDAEELEGKIANAYRYAKNDPGLHGTLSAQETFGHAVHLLSAGSEPNDPPRTRFYPENEEEQEAGGDPTWLIKDLIPDSATIMLYGPTMSYKSFIAVDIALSTAANISTIGGQPVRSGPVFYAAMEGRTSLKKARRRAWKLARGVDAVPDFYVMPGPMLVQGDEPEQFVQAIKDRAAGRRPAMIWLDTMSKIMAGMNENDAKDASQFIRFVDHLRETFDCPVGFVHHTGRDGSHERGSTVYMAGVEVAIEVTADKATKMVKVRIAKMKDAEEREEPWYLEGKAIGHSLAFQPVTKTEYEAATKAESIYTHKKIGGALKALNAYGDDKAITSHVLASAIVVVEQGEDPEKREQKLTRTARTLAKLSDDSLGGYATRVGRELLWSLPAP